MRIWSTRFQATLSLILLGGIILANLAGAQNVRIESKAQDLDAGPLSFTTAFGTLEKGYLSSVMVTFAAAPEAVETVTVSLDSRAGDAFNGMLAKVDTVAGVTTSVVFLFGNAIPLSNGDQIKVTCTNASETGGAVDDPIASATVAVDQLAGFGGAVARYLNGVIVP